MEDYTVMTMANLTKRENEIAELFAWGAAKKDVANILFISERTVENHARTIYEKVGCNKVNELSAWWFCTHFNISFELSPLKRKAMVIAMLLLILPQLFINNEDVVRVFRLRPATTGICRVSRRKSESDTAAFETV
ncbi:MAG: helix-turn-helix transcriptional regulator [Prevotella sp.]|jgi:DNA-binding CsgD family transcriptional regulator|nr:helix-turn-helix transcriptional regulator [Prevotella sp.]